MTPVQFKDARKALGLSQNAMAKSLGLKTSRAIRQYEAGERQVSGPVAVLVAMLLEQANGKNATPQQGDK
jgi:transcriptional regulator with XRE-family HTH domain